MIGGFVLLEFLAVLFALALCKATASGSSDDEDAQPPVTAIPDRRKRAAPPGFYPERRRPEAVRALPH
jgi:hypothetical protein